ncbi:hypothetical protein GQ649_14125 [Rhodococcus sp. DSM 6344]|nr:hypothetical protein [Rhodococcus erythropolis]
MNDDMAAWLLVPTGISSLEITHGDSLTSSSDALGQIAAPAIPRRPA